MFKFMNNDNVVSELTCHISITDESLANNILIHYKHVYVLQSADPRENELF